jgi:uncharacterized protein (DUF952 family)
VFAGAGEGESMAAPDITFHLVPAEIWESQAELDHYRPEAFEREGFIHCTDGEERLIETGNRHCAGDPRPYLAVSIKRDALTSPVIYEDPNEVFPHIYGPLNREAVVSVRRIVRDENGVFLAIES